MKLALRFPFKTGRREPKEAARTEAAKPPLAQAALADLAGWRAQRTLLIGALLALGAVVIVSLNIGEISEFGRRIASTKPSWIGAAIVAQFFAFLFIALACGVALSSLGARRPARDLFPLTLGTLFADQTLPSAGLSGAFFIFHSLTRRGVARDVAATVFILGAASFIAAFLICVAASFVILAAKEQGAISGVTETAGIVFLAFLALAISMIVGALRFGFVRELIARVPFLRSISEFAARAAAKIRTDRTLFARCVGRQLVARAFDILTLWLCFAAIGERTSVETAFVAVSMASLAATLAPTPMGIGTFEGAMVAILSALGAPVENRIDGDAALSGSVALGAAVSWLLHRPERIARAAR